MYKGGRNAVCCKGARKQDLQKRASPALLAAVPLPSGTFGKVQKGRPATGGTGSRGPRVGSGTG